MKRKKELPKDFTVEEAWEELKVLIESMDKDLKKTVRKGVKRAGISTRKGLLYARELITDLYHGTLKEQKEARANKPKHPNKTGAGVEAMLKARGLGFKEN